MPFFYLQIVWWSGLFRYLCQDINNTGQVLYAESSTLFGSLKLITYICINQKL